MGSRFSPKPTISEEDVESGLRWMTREGMASMGLGSITTSGFLAAFALALGANNLHIGILAAIPFIAQPLQIVAIPLVERLRQRKKIAVFTWLPAQLLWLPIALIPLFIVAPSSMAIYALLCIMAFRGVLTAVTNCAWNSWIRDLVPQQVLGRFFARRQALSTGTAMAFGLCAAVFVDYWQRNDLGDPLLGYTIPLLFGILTLGIAGPLFMARMPEPLMQPPSGPQPSLIRTIACPFRDPNYRLLLRFLFLWGLAVNLATPFFAVYMLQKIGLPLTAVLGFTVLSQAANIGFVRVWGGLADRFGLKTILSLCVSLYLLVILGWAFTTMPDRYFMTIPLLIILHILAGVAASGVTLSTGTIGLKLAPEGQATSYLAGAALAINLGSGLGPLLGGLFADFFDVRQLGVTLTWIDPTRSVDLPALHLTGFDFLFGIAFLLGLFTLTVLAALREEGESSREVVLESLYAPMREMGRPMTSIPLLGFLSHFPYSHLRRVKVPGFDVAMGVTAYQIASMAKMATVSASQGKKAMDMIAKPLEESLFRIWKHRETTGEQGSELARHAARGALHAANEVAVDMGQVAHDTMLAVVGSLQQANVDPGDSLRGTAYGIIRGAAESGGDIGEAARKAVQAAGEAGSSLEMGSDVAAYEAAQGALEAAETLGSDAVITVKQALQEETTSVGI